MYQFIHWILIVSYPCLIDNLDDYVYLVKEAILIKAMAEHNDLGHRGERSAEKFLISSGYKILEKNWRYKKAELDLIAMDGEILVFIEVKTRSSLRHGQPYDSISSQKRILMMDAATRYMESIGHEWAIRFDVVSVILNDKEEVVTIHQDSFSPYEE